jgi:hypothetical protein
MRAGLDKGREMREHVVVYEKLKKRRDPPPPTPQSVLYLIEKKGQAIKETRYATMSMIDKEVIHETLDAAN